MEQTQLRQTNGDEIILQTRGLTKYFGDEAAVQDVSFEVPRGKIFGFIGPSGCGKTTTVRLLTGLYTPTSGEVTVLGQDPQRFSQLMQARIGYMPQLFVLYPDLSVWENLNFTASLYGVDLRRKKRLNQLLDFVELGEHREKLVRNISGGMQRRLSLATALVHNPELLFLDEPTVGIDPILRRKFWDHFKALQNEGHTLFVTTQYVGEAAYCDYVGLMVEGRLLMVAPPEELRRHAFGGEVVELRTTEGITYRQIRELKMLPCVRGDVRRTSETEVRLVVDEASTATPMLLKWCAEEEVEVESIEEYQPPFDDVFVKLVTGDKNNG